MPGDREGKLKSLGYPLDRVPGVAALYRPLAIDGTTLYSAGAIPFDMDKHLFPGKVVSQVPVADAQKAAALCVANILRNVRKELGSLDRIDRVLRLAGYVNSDPGFSDQ